MSIYDDSAADDVPVWEPQSQPMIGFDDTIGRRLRVYSAREVSRWIEQRFPGRYNTQQLFYETTAK